MLIVILYINFNETRTVSVIQPAIKLLNHI